MKLISIDEYKKGQRPQIPTEEWSPTGVACPKCGREMYVNHAVVLASLPPQKAFVCLGGAKKCGHREYVLA